MAKGYSLDLRERVLKYLEKNDDKKIACDLFEVSLSTVFRWVRRKKEKGSVAAFKRKHPYKKIDEQALLDYVKNHEDYFLSEIGEHFSMTAPGIFYALKRLKVTRKKKPLSIRREMKKKENNLSKS